MENWQALQNWFFFAVVAGALTWYYLPTTKKPAKTAPAVIKETKEKVKKPFRKPEPKKAAAPSTEVADNDATTSHGNQKRKATAVVDQKTDADEIDMSTRQFAESMAKARQGIQMKSGDKSQQRVRTVKTGTPLLSSGSSTDGEEDWSAATSAAPRAGAIDDMLEPSAPGPNALRIVAPQGPVKERAPKQPKKVEVETKKQRQNRKKAEEKRAAREADEALQNQKKENQRRTAREARGEPAKNGTAALAPVHNPWAEKNAARDEQLPVQSSHGGNVQLLDTFETESNSSSNQEVSTAATSTTDGAPSRWADDVTHGQNIAKAMQESSLESGWNEVKSSKKLSKKKSQAETKSANTSGMEKSPVASRFGALKDEAEQTATGDFADSAWTA